MNKVEIERKIKIHENAIIASESVIAELKTQLAENPEFEHGDFGMWKGVNYGFVVDKSKKDEIYLLWKSNDLRNQMRQDISLQDISLREVTIFGNIFKMMEDWGEDFGSFEKVNVDYNSRKIILEKSTSTQAELFITVEGAGNRGDGAHLSLSELKNLWLKLGHALADMKRKQS